MTAAAAFSTGLDIGRRSFGRYELLAPIARGGMAMVWAARLKGTRGFEKLVAIKTMLPGMSEHGNFERMFLDEAKLAARIRHPHVVEILDLGEEQGILYLVMEWVEGEPLSVVMRKAEERGGIPVAIGVRMIMQACAGLHAAHELKDEDGEPLGLVHRDVSPQNLLVTYDGITKMADFGIAKTTARGGGSTAIGEVKGKIAYMAPEQATAGNVDRRTDVFALGVILYQLATGKHPFRGQTEGETLANIMLLENLKPPRFHAPNYPSSLEAVVLKALSREPVHRYESANALSRALDKALPPSLRGAVGDEEVGAFVRSLLGEAREKGRAKLAAALLDAERVARPTASAASKQAEIATEPPVAPGVPDTDGGSAVERLTTSRPRSRWPVLAAAAAVAAAALAIGLATRGKDEPERPSPASEPAVHANAPVVPVAAPAPAAEAPAESAVAPSSSAPPAASSERTPPRAVQTRRVRASSSKPSKSEKPDSKPRTSTSTGTGTGTGLSPVRTPGF